MLSNRRAVLLSKKKADRPLVRLLGQVVGDGELSWTWHDGCLVEKTDGQQFLSVAAGVVHDLMIHLGGSASVKMALYADDSDKPGALLGFSSAVAGVAGWNIVPLTVPVVVTDATLYWIVFKADTPYTVTYLIEAGAVTTRTDSAYSSAFPEPFIYGPLGDYQLALSARGYI